MSFQIRTWNFQSMGLFLLVVAPIALSLLHLAQDLYSDADMIRTAALHREVDPLRSELIRRAGRLEQYLESQSKEVGTSGAPHSLSEEDPARLLEVWKSLDDADPAPLYWSLVDTHGTIILHSDSTKAGQRITSEWDDDKLQDAGANVVRIHSGPLTGDRESIDVYLPLEVNGERVGSVHEGIDAAQFDRRVAAQRKAVFWERKWLIGLLLVVNCAAVAGVIYWARRFSSLQERLQSKTHEDSQRLAQLGIGLAHEVRNPLHALRINMHTLRRSIAGKTLSEQEMTEMMRESCDEIDRMESLMRDFVQYTAPQADEKAADVELEREIQATLQLLGEELRRRRVDVEFPDSKPRLMVHIAPSRLRAIALELLTFAQRSAGADGKIEISQRSVGGFAELSITDNGRELSRGDHLRLFEPFQQTPHSNAGLGLALIFQYAQECGGSLVRRQIPGGNSFVLRLPLARKSMQGETA